MKIVASGNSTLGTTMILLSYSMVVIFQSHHGVYGQPLLEDPSYQHPASETASTKGPYDYLFSDDPKERTYGQTHFNKWFPTEVFYKGDTKYDIPYDDNFNTTNTTFDDIVVNNYKYFDAETEPPTFDPKLDANNGIQSMKDMMEITSMDGIIVMKDGNILVEQYRNGFDAKTRHNAFSMTKSFSGVMVEMMMEDPNFNISEKDLIIDHIPELNIDGGAFQNVTVREVLDMTAQFQWKEDYDSFDDCLKSVAEIFYHNSSLPLVPVPIGVDFPTPEGCEILFDDQSRTHRLSPEFWLNITNNSYARYPGPQSSKDSLMNLKDDVKNDNGVTFVYRTANTMILGWLIENLTDGKGMEWFSEKIWGQIGQNSDGLILVDQEGFPFYGAGSMFTLMDAVRYGEMMRNDGKNYLGEQIVPKSVVDDISAGGTKENIKQFTYGPHGCYQNCPLTSSKDACVPELCGGSWKDFKLPNNVPVMQYLNALNDGGNYSQGITTGGVYRNQYWILPNHMYRQAGIYGQTVAVFPKIGLVIAIFSSSPDAMIVLAPVSNNMFFTIAAEYANMETSTSTSTTATSEIPNDTSEESISSSSMIRSLTMASSLFAVITMTAMTIIF